MDLTFVMQASRCSPSTEETDN